MIGTFALFRVVIVWAVVAPWGSRSYRQNLQQNPLDWGTRCYYVVARHVGWVMPGACR